MKGKVGVSRETVEKDLKKMSDIVLNELVRPEEHGLIISEKKPAWVPQPGWRWDHQRGGIVISFNLRNLKDKDDAIIRT